MLAYLLVDKEGRLNIISKKKKKKPESQILLKISKKKGDTSYINS